MTVLSKFAFALSAMTVSAPPDPAGFVPHRNFAPTIVAFDDRTGKGYEWTKPLPCGANRATVMVRFDQGYPKFPQASLGKIWLHSGVKDSPTERWIAASLKSPTDRWKLDGLAWLEDATNAERKTVGGYGPVELNKPLRIDLAWTADGIVTARFGGEFSKQASMGGPITDIGVGGSLAKFAFLSLTVGREGPPDPACSQSATTPVGSWQPTISGMTAIKD